MPPTTLQEAGTDVAIEIADVVVRSDGAVAPAGTGTHQCCATIV
jgi:hypothetical protein